ncbi:unnamed protein product [Zymoseptoria tritici ST99CH_1A5]|uniref:Uncharacterized protein n=1 Tax=Zymoseptoria tritici ST99CH_1A5 TaxID=1276529 RepID=A0A1Y6LUH5_ZYMTR|nr:unnamed protein product [Zymoseptoria tritici ST99CH_3D1]SMY28046.1 unnamed protein product [Zymoseptoria tritici ST99CH_1A5]
MARSKKYQEWLDRGQSNFLPQATEGPPRALFPAYNDDDGLAANHLPPNDDNPPEPDPQAPQAVKAEPAEPEPGGEIVIEVYARLPAKDCPDPAQVRPDAEDAYCAQILRFTLGSLLVEELTNDITRITDDVRRILKDDYYRINKMAIAYKTGEVGGAPLQGDFVLPGFWIEQIRQKIAPGLAAVAEITVNVPEALLQISTLVSEVPEADPAVKQEEV